MRHRKSGRKLGRNSSHRKAMYRNMVTSLLEHGRITTTEAKAKELRKFTERTISKAVRVQDIIAKDVEARTPQEKARLVHAMRMAGRLVRSRQVLGTLFNKLGPIAKNRGGESSDKGGGYTRITKVGPRVGDNAPMAVIEVLDMPREAEAAA